MREKCRLGKRTAALERDTRVALFAAPLRPEQVTEVVELLAEWNVPFVAVPDNVRVDLKRRNELLLRLSLAGVPHPHLESSSEVLAKAGPLTPQSVLDAQEPKVWPPISRPECAACRGLPTPASSSRRALKSRRRAGLVADLQRRGRRGDDARLHHPCLRARRELLRYGERLRGRPRRRSRRPRDRGFSARLGRARDQGVLSDSGASMKGEFENRLRMVIEEVQSSPKPMILFDEAHTLIGAGGAAGTGDAANLLKPALARGTLRTVAATTWPNTRNTSRRTPR